jgi:hypothetical protein
LPEDTLFSQPEKKKMRKQFLCTNVVLDNTFYSTIVFAAKDLYFAAF